MYLDGQVIEHPLDSWDKFRTWQPPSVAERVRGIAGGQDGDLEHGFLFLRLTYLRGFENFMIDVAEENPKFYELRDIVANYWYEVAKAYLDSGAKRVIAADDLGMQDRLFIRPDSWRKLIKPAYRRIFSLTRERGATVRFHTDGYVVDIIPDLIEIGVTDLNIQDLVNGLDNLARLAKGKIQISLDIDRQSVMFSGTPAEIDAHIENCIRTLGSPQGGLRLGWGVYPGTPIENIEAGARAMQKHHLMFEKSSSHSPFLGLRIQQHRETVPTFDRFIRKLESEHKTFDRIIELGTGNAGFISFVALRTMNAQTRVFTFDNVDVDQETKQSLKNLNISFVQGDVIHDTRTVQRVKDLISADGRVLLLCDDGSKAQEFTMYAPYLKRGDFIMAHDYIATKDEFEQSYRGRIWDYCELTWDDVEATARRSGLSQYMQQEFSQVVWLCMEKTTDAQLVSENGVVTLYRDANSEELESVSLKQLENLWDSLSDDAVLSLRGDFGLSCIDMRSLLARAGFVVPHVLEKDGDVDILAWKPELDKNELVRKIKERMEVDVEYPDILTPPERRPAPDVRRIHHVQDPELSIIFIAYSHLEDRTTPSLRWLKLALAELDSTELICVDDGSEDGTFEFFLENADIAVRMPERCGICDAYNAAIPVSKGKYICIFQNDFIVTASIISKMLEFMKERPDVALIAAKWFDERNIHNYGDEFLIIKPKDQTYVSGVCNLMRRDALEQIGLYDELLYNAYEDWDISIAFRSLGYYLARLQRPLGYNIAEKASTVHDLSIYTDVQRARRLASAYYFFLKWNLARPGKIWNIIESLLG